MTKYSFDATAFVQSIYKQEFYYHRPFIESPGIWNKLFSTSKQKNIAIYVTDGSKQGCLITDNIPDFHFIGDSQCFPLYWYEENKGERGETLFGEVNSDRWMQRDGITDRFLKEVRSSFSVTVNLSR